jgi:hypothetical protein
MKIISIKGGLGNQFFQYAYGRNFMISNKKEVIFDISFFIENTKDTQRSFLLDKFNIDNSVTFKNIKRNIFIKIFKKIYSKITGNYGFYQNEKYFKDIEDVIYKEFTLKNTLTIESKKWEEKIQSTPISISLHIRRGDYINNLKTKSIHGLCDIDYYERAVKLLKEKIDQDFEIFIFSDDIEWVRENLKLPYSMNFVSNSEIPDYEEMYLMSLCKNNIMANSSFSWWCAWLNKNPNKIVVGPKQWLVNKTSNELNILPKEWIQI